MEPRPAGSDSTQGSRKLAHRRCRIGDTAAFSTRHSGLSARSPRIGGALARLALLLALCGTSGAVAHDFWVQPNEYWQAPNVPIPITLQVGHGPFRQRSPIPLHRIVRFAAIALRGTPLDLRGSLHLGDRQEDGSLRFAAPGTYLVFLETDNRAQSHLPALRFNDYLRAEGLTSVLAQRERTHRMDSDGSETYSRCSKSILQVGRSEARSQAQVTQAVGLPLEIVPEISPYTQPRPASFPVRVLYTGRPLPGALVKLTNLAHDSEPVESHLTDRAGRASFAMPSSGAWLLNVVWSTPLPASRETDFATVFSSLSFGFP